MNDIKEETVIYALGGAMAAVGVVLIAGAVFLLRANYAKAPDIIKTLNYWRVTVSCTTPAGEGGR